MIWLGITTSLDVMISKSIRGWKNTLRAFRAVPAEALIFEFCTKGNVEGVRTLLARGDASVWDRDPDGMTPLHVSVILSVFVGLVYHFKTQIYDLDTTHTLVRDFQEFCKINTSKS